MREILIDLVVVALRLTYDILSDWLRSDHDRGDLDK